MFHFDDGFFVPFLVFSIPTPWDSSDSPSWRPASGWPRSSAASIPPSFRRRSRWATRIGTTAVRATPTAAPRAS